MNVKTKSLEPGLNDKAGKKNQVRGDAEKEQRPNNHRRPYRRDQQ